MTDFCITMNIDEMMTARSLVDNHADPEGGPISVAISAASEGMSSGRGLVTLTSGQVTSLRLMREECITRRCRCGDVQRAGNNLYSKLHQHLPMYKVGEEVPCKLSRVDYRTYSYVGKTGTYTVSLEGYSCTCAGFAFRQACRHLLDTRTRVLRYVQTHTELSRRERDNYIAC